MDVFEKIRAQRGVGAFCHLAAEHRESIPVCLYWEGTDDEMPMQEELREAQRDVPASAPRIWNTRSRSWRSMRAMRCTATTPARRQRRSGGCAS